MLSLAQRYPNTLVAGTGLLLLVVSFMLTYWMKYGELSLVLNSFGLLALLGGSWLLANLLMNLPSRLLDAPFATGVALILKAILGLFFMVSLLVQLLEWNHLPRTMVYGPGVGLALWLVALFVLFRRYVAADADVAGSAGDRCEGSVQSLQLMVFDGLLLTGVYYAAVASVWGGAENSDLVFMLLGFWLMAALITGKFKRCNFNNYVDAAIPALKALMIMAGGMAMTLFLLRLHDYPGQRFAVFFCIYFALESGIFLLYVRYRRQRTTALDLDDVAEISRFLKQEQKEIPLPQKPKVTEPATRRVKEAVEKGHLGIYRFLSEAIDLCRIDVQRCTIMDTEVLANLEFLQEGSRQLIVNLHKINDVRRLNRYFLTAHTRLEAGGYLVGHAQTIATRRRYYAHRYPRPFDSIFYAVNFLWHRACPKLPWLKKLYFAVTKGRNRQVSRAEILGRMYFCGFKIVAEQEIDHRFYFVARKVKESSYDENPTYGPLVKLRRFGRNGEPLEVLKFRTMFPYSEYLQEYIYEHQRLDQGGKFNNDFRVTGWGRFMRRTWLDELPMLWNWVRGEMQLIGVRPLSAQYLSLYSDDVKHLRARVKPGLLPPFYADMPQTLDEIMASEARYIERYLQNPLKTQITYFCRCFVNIVFKGKRSK